MLHEFKHPNGKHSSVWLSNPKLADVGKNKYTVICENHGALIGASSVKDAIRVANNTHNFCDDCRDEMLGKA